MVPGGKTGGSCSRGLDDSERSQGEGSGWMRAVLWKWNRKGLRVNGFWSRKRVREVAVQGDRRSSDRHGLQPGQFRLQCRLDPT